MQNDWKSTDGIPFGWKRTILLTFYTRPSNAHSGRGPFYSEPDRPNGDEQHQSSLALADGSDSSDKHAVHDLSEA